MLLNYSIDGSGIPLVLLHGYPFDHTLWKEVVPLLSKEAAIIAPDLQPDNRYLDSIAGFSINDLAANVIETISHIGYKRAIYIGHSMGGYVALEIARHHPENVLGLGLAASHIYGDSERKKVQRKNTMEIIREKGVSEALKSMPAALTGNANVQRYCLEKIQSINTDYAIAALKAMADRKPATDVWLNVDCPRCIIAGGSDQIVSISLCQKMASVEKNIHLYVIDSSGHMPMLENPQMTASSINNFLEKNFPIKR